MVEILFACIGTDLRKHIPQIGKFRCVNASNDIALYRAPVRDVPAKARDATHINPAVIATIVRTHALSYLPSGESASKTTRCTALIPE